MPGKRKKIALEKEDGFGECEAIIDKTNDNKAARSIPSKDTADGTK